MNSNQTNVTTVTTTINATDWANLDVNVSSLQFSTTIQYKKQKFD